MDQEPINVWDDGETVYAEYENEDGTTYTEVYGVLDPENDNGGYYVDVSGDYDGFDGW